jgi:hypothetical protein
MRLSCVIQLQTGLDRSRRCASLEEEDYPTRIMARVLASMERQQSSGASEARSAE